MTVLSCLCSRNFQQLRSLVPSYICLHNISCFTREEYNRVQPDIIILGSKNWSNEKALLEDRLPFSRKILLWGNEHDTISDVIYMMEKGFSYFPYPNTHEKLNDFILIHSRKALNTDIYRDMGLQGNSSSMIDLKKTISQFAPNPAAVTLLGETGTGKELCAKAIHKYSRRCGSFVPVNCAAIPETLLETELFGSIRGAYTDSISKIGYFETAHEGTLFLDEIAELPTRMQAKLLRIIEDKRVTRLGSTQSRKVNVRIICATSADLRKMMKEGSFRNDLYYRLSVLVIEIPPLRERKTDIPQLCQYLLTMDKSSKTITTKAMMKLLDYSWPGNIRELSSIIKRAVILSESENDIKIDHIQFY
jgi:transcriptional regulator with PAS, ATPase and Fis domain